MNRIQQFGLLFGPAAFAIFFLLPAPADLSPAGWHTLGVATWMAAWWMTEAIPISATALLPLALFPLIGSGTVREVAAPYADPVIYLFMGGFMIALAMERWDLHRRVALHVIRMVGTSPNRLVAGFLLATALISMWVNNTATTMMMLPVALSVLDVAERSGGVKRGDHFEVALLLTIAYGSSIGGMGTLVGTAPNMLMAGFFEQQYGITIGFVEWLAIGLPTVLIGLPLSYLLLTRVSFPLGITELPGAREGVERDLASLGPVSRQEWAVAVVFVATALAWVFRPLLEDAVPGISDGGIAIVGALSLFIIPAGEGRFVLDWETARKLPWGTLVLFGGGLSLADSLTRTGLSGWIGSALAVETLPLLVVILLVTAGTVFLTELASNTATVATFLPVVAALAVGMGENPILLAAPAVLAATCGFMLPVGTPPNAIVFATERVRMRDMLRAGLWLDLLFIVILVALAYTVFGWALGAQHGVLPPWATPSGAITTPPVLP